MAGHEHNYQAPQVEDYDSENDDPVVIREALPRKASPTAQANVSTKRSNDLKTEKVPASEKMMPNIDLRSDSGYSSFTAASKSSADSAPSATSRSPPVLPTTTAPVVSQAQAPKPRRPTVGEQRQHSNESSPRQKPISRTASVSSRQRPVGTRRQTITQDPRDNPDEECRDPNCDCGRNALVQRSRPGLKPTSSARNVSNVSNYDQRSQVSAPDPYYSPPSPTYTRQPAPYASQGPAIIQTARSRRPSSMSRPRPQSFAGDPSAGYWSSMPAPYPSPPQERGGPPPAYYNNMQNMQNMQNMPPYGASPIPPYMGSGHPGGYYPQPNQQYEAQQRPQISARGPSNYGQRPNAPIITQDDNDRSKYSARRGQQPTYPKPKLLQYSPEDDQAAESDYSESEEEYDEREERRRAAEIKRALMPPPKIKRDPSQRRPPLPHAKTTQVVERLETDRRRERRQSIVDPERRVHQERERERERERPQRVSAAPARRASVSRPPPRHQHSQSEYNTRNARVIVNDSRSDRRRSYQPNEKTYEDYVKARAVEDQYKAERMREKRASRVVQERFIPGQFDDDEDEEDEEEEQEEEPVRVLNRPRRKTETDHRKGKDRTSEIKAKANNAEEYMKTRGGRDPWADQINKGVLKRSSRVPSNPSDSGSSHSSKASQSNQTTMTSTTNNEIRLRVDGTMPLSLQLSGDMEGRTLQLVPAENGMTDLVIGGGNPRSGETVYRSEKGSISGSANNNRRSIIAGQGRRDAEDFSDRGSRSARSRRDRSDEIQGGNERDRHVLRRTRTTAYH